MKPRTPNKPASAVPATRETVADVELRDLCIRTLIAVMQDPEAAASARGAAARTGLELAGLLGKHAPDPATAAGSLEGMEAADLRAELARLRASRIRDPQ